LAIERVLQPSAASRTIRARLRSRCCVRGERHRASSSLRSWREADFSCFGNHPDLESRLTFQEKWVLAGGDIVGRRCGTAASAGRSRAADEVDVVASVRLPSAVGAPHRRVNALTDAAYSRHAHPIRRCRVRHPPLEAGFVFAVTVAHPRVSIGGRATAIAPARQGSRNNHLISGARPRSA